MLRISLKTIIVLFLIISQISFLAPSYSDWPKINLVILGLSFLVFYGEFISLLWWSLLIGFLLDLFSLFPFGVSMIVIMATTMALYFLFQNFLTNRSVYTFVFLSISGTLIYNLLLLISSFIFPFLNLTAFTSFSLKVFWPGVFWQIIYNALWSFIFFISIHFVKTRLQKKFMLPK